MSSTPEKLRIDPIVELIIGILIVHPDRRPRHVKTYDDARAYAEAWAKGIRRAASQRD